MPSSKPQGIIFDLTSEELVLNGINTKIPRDIIIIKQEKKFKTMLLQFLANVIYVQLHKRVTFKIDIEEKTHTIHHKKNQALINLLDLSNQGICWPDSNWIALSGIEDEKIRALNIKSGIKVKLPISKVNFHNDNSITVQRSKSQFNTCPGYYVGISDLGMPEVQNNKLARVYINTTIEGSCRLVKAISSFAKFNQVKLYFKTSNNSYGYGYSDSFVIYLTINDFEQLKPKLVECISKLSMYFRKDISIFCQPLSFGSSFTYETQNRNIGVQSFGEKRSEELARQLLDSKVL